MEQGILLEKRYCHRQLLVVEMFDGVGHGVLGAVEQVAVEIEFTLVVTGGLGQRQACRLDGRRNRLEVPTACRGDHTRQLVVDLGRLVEEDLG